MSTPVTAPGRLIVGRYRLESRIGGGGMGAVWKARDELLGRTVAVKQVLPPADADLDEAEAQRQRALREGRIAARLSNIHAISIYDVALEDGQPWLIMEYLPSRSLAAVLEEDGVLRVDQVAQIGAQVADALAATHAAGIIHRDVKPANVLIGRGERVEGLVKITDFGISHAQGDVTLTRTGQITGTPAFLSPEVAQGQEPGPASDVFSLGATLYTCLEGQPPFGMGDNTLQQLYRVAAGEVIPPRRAGGLTDPLLRMLAVDPADRPAMTEVRDELARLAAGRDGNTTTVLLGRTDLRRGPRGTKAMPSAVPTSPPTALPYTRTDMPSAAARDAPSAAGAGARGGPPAASPAASPAGSSGKPRRRAALWIAVGALVALLIGGGVVLRLSRDSASPAAQEPPSSATSAGPTQSRASPSSTAATSSTPASSAAPTSSTPATSATPVPPGAVRATDVQDFLGRYHGLLPDQADAAWQLTGPTLRGAISQQGYLAFWRQFTRVGLSDVRAQDGSLTATGSLQFEDRNGRTRTERHQFTLVVGSDGQLLMDRDVTVG